MDSQPSILEKVKPIPENIDLPPSPFLIDHKYEVKGLLGRGGGGEALLAFHQKKPVCIKLLKTNLVKNRNRAIDKFKKEFNILKKLNHPNIGHLYDFGYDSALERHFFAGEFIEGDHIYKASRHLPHGEFEKVILQVLQALHYLHTFGGKGIRHNDIKAANILVQTDTATPNVKLIDFGLASFGTLQVKGGTASCMAPEQIAQAFPKYSDGKKYPKPDLRADLYSLGVVWYHCATGVNPFLIKRDPVASMKKHFEKMPPYPSQINPDIPSYWDPLILKLLAVHPDDRFESAAHVIQELAMLSGKPYSVIPEKQREFYIPEGEWIGRNQQWRLAKNVWEAVAQGQSKPTLLWVTGERGVGKSKFLKQLKSLVQSQDGRTLFLEAADDNAIHEWINETRTFSADTTKPIVIGIDDFDRLTESTYYPAIQEALHLVSKHVRYHIQWKRKEGPPKILFICTSNDATLVDPDFFKSRMRLDFLNTQAIDIPSFTLEELRTFLNQLSSDKSDRPPEHFVKKLMDHTNGNPHFVHITLKTLGAEGLLFDDSGQWHATLYSDIGIDFDELPVPQSLIASLKENWKRLNSEERELLSWVAAFQEPATETSLFKLNPKLSTTAAIQLVNADILHRENGRLAFKNSFFHRTVYQHIPRKKRQNIHDAIRQFMVEQNAPEHLIAYHTAHGSDLSQQRQAWETLACFSEQTYRWSQAAHYYQEALMRFRKASKADKYRWVSHIAQNWIQAGRFDEAITLLNRWIRKGKWEETEAGLQALLRHKKGLAYLKKNDTKAARKILKEALKQITPHKHRHLWIAIQNTLASVMLHDREPKEGLAIFQKTAQLAHALTTEEQEEIKNNEISLAYLKLGRYQEAEEQLQQDLKQFTQTNDRVVLSRLHYLMGETKRQLRQFDNAISHFNQSIELSRKTKDADRLMRSYNGMAAVYLDRGQSEGHKTAYDQALKYFQLSLALCQHLRGDMAQVNTEIATLYTNIGIIQVELGKYKQAMDTYHTLLTVLEKKEKLSLLDRHCLTASHLELGECYSHEGSWLEAEEHLRQAEEYATQSPVLWEPLFGIYLNWAQLKRDQGEFAEIGSFLEKANRCLKKKKFAPTPLAQKRLNELRNSVSG